MKRLRLLSAFVVWLALSGGGVLGQEQEKKPEPKPAPKETPKAAPTQPGQTSPPGKVTPTQPGQTGNPAKAPTTEKPGAQATPKRGEPASVKPGMPAAQSPKQPAEPEEELQRAVVEAGNDRAALVSKLEDYLKRNPETPYKPEVYRAIVESSMQLKDSKRALEYAERYVALRPDDAAMLLFAVELLEQAGDEASLRRAVGYATRVLDRVEKADAARKPPRTSQEEWDAQQKQLQMSIYLMRGRLEMERKNYDAAATDLEKSCRLQTNAAAALRLGEIAELRGQKEKAIEQYLVAFVLPDQLGVPVDRAEVRRKLGNLWKQVYGNEDELGRRLLEAYDKAVAESKPEVKIERNAGVQEVYGFELRRIDGGAAVKLGEAKDKVLVLSYWATWCLPCREQERLFEQVERQYAGQADVVFYAVNTDEDEALVKPYVEREKVRSMVVYADGLDVWMKIASIPTVMVLDRNGKIVYRASGFAPEGFTAALSQAIEKARAGAN